RWEAAVHVTSRHPFAGIGVGAFRYEVENFGRLGRQNWPGFDNTNNFYLQIAAELGVIGLALVVGVLAAITAAIVRVIRSPQLRGETCLVYLALATSWVVFLVLFLTGPHLLFEQNQAMFWLIAAVFMKQHESLLTPQPTRLRWMIALGGVGLIAVTAFQLADGFGKLSPARRRTVLGLAHTQGFYPRETEETGRRFRWTRERALISVPTTHAEIRVEMIARHPDLATSPVGVLLTVDGKQPRRFEISKTEWQWIRYPVPSGVSSPANLEIQVERTWRPDDWVHNKDKRTLGVGVARIENADPSEPLPP
ncbi:O-antigen ligase family protein, partial [Candidatus Sumerlaeota bacterium]|nr:O-antigen ligase family protein [Candidatus Sumerlaeota bacterium]